MKPPAHKLHVLAPVPQRRMAETGALGPATGPHSPRASSPLHPNYTLFTPNTTMSLRQHKRPSYGSIESERERAYSLDYPDDAEELARAQLDPQSRFYARLRKRTLDLPLLLPYATEKPLDKAKFLAHIVAHLYIAVKTLDLQGAIPVTAKDLACLRDVPGLLDIDLALETNLFELGDELRTTEGPNADEEYFEDDMGFDDDDEDEDENSDDDDDGDHAEAVDEYASGDGTNQHKKSPRSAAVVSVRIWTQELLVWLKMKYDMPVALRMSLARVYYAICCCRGQHLGLKIYVKAFETLTKNVDFLRDQLFLLPWEPLYEELTLHFPSANALHEPVEKKDLGLLLKVGERASNFYAPEALPVLFRHLASHYSIPNAAVVLWCMRVLPQLFVCDFAHSENPSLDIRHYIAPLFYMWKKLSKSTGVDSHVTCVLGRLSMSYVLYLAQHPDDLPQFGTFGVFSKAEFVHLINTLLNSLGINRKKFGSLQTKFFHGFACAIAFSINGSSALEKDGILDHLDTLLNAVESYVHPSNTGEWSKPLSKMVLSLAYQFTKRYNMEREKNGALAGLPDRHKLSDAIVQRFVQIMLPLVRTGLQSKKNSAVEEYLVALGYLAHLNASATLSYMLLDIYESLQGVISTHRVITALRCMEELTRYFAATPLFRIHIPRILELILPGIDSNDLTKTIHTLDVFATVASFVPIADLTAGEGDPTMAMEVTNMQLDFLERRIFQVDVEELDIDPETEIRALKSATASFKYIIKALAQRLFTLFESIPDPSVSGGIEKYLCDTLPKLIYLIVESMSDDIFRAFRDEIFTFVNENTIQPLSEVIAELCGSLIKRDPQYLKHVLPNFIDKIKEEILENGAGQSRTGSDIIPRDQALYWNILILGSCVGNADHVIVDLGQDLNELSFFLMAHVKGPTVFGSTFLLNQILQGVSKIRLAETRLINPAYLERCDLDEKCWGGFQFDDYRFSNENLTFKWFIPEERDVKFAVDSFKAHITKALSNILTVFKAITSNARDASSVELSDELRANFLYLGYGMSGMSYLFDPLFDEDIPKLSDHKSETIQNRLKLLTQIRAMKDAKFTEEDEPLTGSISENLQEIADDINGLDEFLLHDSEKEDEFEREYLERNFIPSMKSDESLEATEASKRSEIHSLRLSESPVADSSARASPQLAGVDVSSMNPAITFRERKLYTSRYYFGDDIEARRSNEMYLQIHRMRHLVGKSLHYIFRFMHTHLSDNTKMFKHLLYTLNIWFGDVGKERLLDHPHARISLTYINELQQINRVRKPFTRFGFGSRIEAYHLLRVALHATFRLMTDLDRILIEDIAKLSCSGYTSIAEPAQSTLMDTMKRVNGSYNTVIRSAIRSLTKAILETNTKRIRSALSVFELKRIKNKLHNDFTNLSKYIGLLHKCFTVDDEEVNEIAHRSFKELCGQICPPRKICILQHDLVDSVRPLDEFIDLEVKAVTYAKEKKRGLYLKKIAKIEELLINHEKTNHHWKTSCDNMLLLIDLQIEYEVPTSQDVFALLSQAARSDHPVVSKTALKGLTKLLNKLEVLSSYNYDIEDAYKPSYVMKGLEQIDTRPHGGESYSETWKKELKNEHPEYYVDYRMGRGWLFWDDTALVVSNDVSPDFNLSDEDEALLKAFSKQVNKAWFSGIVELWLTENEVNFAFQGTDVFFTALIVSLIQKNYICNLALDDVLAVIGSIYEPEEKSSHIVVCELVTGVLIASKSFDADAAQKRDDFLVGFITNIFQNDLTPETKVIWNIFAWWLPAHIDSRRFPRIRDVILGFKLDKDSDSALMEATVLGYMKSFVSAITLATPDPLGILDMCFDNVTNRYEAVREQIGSLLVVTSFTFYGDSFADADAFIEAAQMDQDALCFRSLDKHFYDRLSELFDHTQKLREGIANLETQAILKSDYIYCATTILSWLTQALNTSVASQYQRMVDQQIVPFLLGLLALKEVCILGKIDPVSAFTLVSQIHFDAESLQRIVDMLDQYSEQQLNYLQYLALGEFTEILYFRNLFKLTFEQKTKIMNFTNSMMYHKNLEMREALAKTFAGLIYTTPPNEIEEIVMTYKKRFSSDLDRIRKRYKKGGFKNIAAADLITLHGATLGLGALVHAFSFSSPPPAWIPNILSILSKKATGLPGVVGRSAKETLGKFKKTRQDTWHIDSRVFNEEQMQDLEGVLWRSYII